jgi:superfamily I DNA and/or RNA helicase
VIQAPYTNLPLGFSQRAAFNSVMLKSECHQCIYELKKESGEILRQEGHTLGIIDKFLEYQISLEDKKRVEPVFVETYKRVPSESGHAAIAFDQPIAEETLDLEGDPVINVKIKQRSLKEDLDDELVWVGDGVLKQMESGYKISFKDEIDVTLLDRGFYIEKRISKRQLIIQREIIRDFLEKKIRIDHIESLLIRPELTKTPVLARVDFINEDLKKSAGQKSNNNQVKAVKKAVGNQNIFLIQGPPGTGKTTVIAEIISQLTCKKQKILVAGQNHVAVDNVLKKMAKDANLALLRVGNPEKVDQELVHYCIDNLSEDYKADFKLFIQHQGDLAEEYLNLRLSNLGPEEINARYRAKVNSVSEEYGRLKDRYRNMHFRLQQALVSLPAKHIENAVQILQNWSSNIQSEYDLLLQPLIYNSVDVVFATCIGIKTDPMFRQLKKKFDTVIIDEAGKANIAETIVAMELGKKVVLVGDQMQLPPYIDGSYIDEKNPDCFQRTEFGREYQLEEIQHALKTSFLEFIINRIKKDEFPSENLVLLNYQHRMHPHIGEFVSASFYDNKVQMGADTHLQRLPLPTPLDKEVIFFDTSNTPDRFEKQEALSVRNDCEASVIVEQVLPLLFDNQVKPENIAIIAPYKKQVNNIQRYISDTPQISSKQIDVSTLDSFQGKEYDVIIFSFTRSTNHSKAPVIDGKKKFGKVGFLDDARRLNVAFSRAKKKLILIGDAQYLTDRRSHYDFLFDYTGLFKKLVALTHDSRLGRFINIANDKPGQARTSQEPAVKQGDIMVGKVGKLRISEKTQKPFALFIQLPNGSALAKYYHNNAVLNKNLQTFEEGATVHMLVVQTEGTQYPIVQLLPKNWAEVSEAMISGGPLQAFFECDIPGGYLLKLSSGLTGMILRKDLPRNARLAQGNGIDVVVKSFDYSNYKIKFKLHHG